MDYHFSTDPIHDYVARFSMEHCALGYWLTAEIGANSQRIRVLLSAIEQIQQRRSWQFELEGNEYSLQLSPEQAVVKAHSLFPDSHHSDDQEFGDGLDYFDDESSAHCGLDDFKALLIDWQSFVSSR